MPCLGSKTYDPATAATKGTVASAMAAFDTTNSRITFTVPSTGRVFFRVKAQIHGAITFSQFLLGVMNGATVVARVTPQGSILGTALATTLVPIEASGTIEGLTAGASVTWDSAWACETFVTGSLIKYGGPNNTTANDAFGALLFEVWDA